MLGLQSLADGISDVDGRVVATSGGGNHTNSAGLMVNVSTDSNLELAAVEENIPAHFPVLILEGKGWWVLYGGED